jgi:dolichyl-diphosphooligosaccharide--protein glycosyltransferase
MQWLRENTPEDAVIASWWDYGYWISTLAERKTLADNSTLLDWQIRKIAATYMSTPEDAWRILTSDADTDVSSYYVTLPDDITNPTKPTDSIYDEKQNKLDAFKKWKDDPTIEKIYDAEIDEKYPTLFDYWESEVYVIPPVITGLDADYIIVNLAVQKLSAENIMDLYVIKQKGGDETKAFWFLKIADLPFLDYYNPELSGYSNKFWDETLLGKLIPFTHIVYVDTDNSEIQSETFKPGYTSIYIKDIKFPADGDGPFQLVYVPSSFEMDAPGPLTGPLIYKINKEYNPDQ